MKNKISLIFRLLINDLKQISRDKTLAYFSLIPLLLFLLIKLGLPNIINHIPQIKDYVIYYIIFSAIQGAIMFGFVNSFIILDEKDEKIIQAIKVLPISSNFYWIYRSLFGFIISYLAAFAILYFNGVIAFSFTISILYCILYALVTPLLTLCIGTFAKNKIEGMAWFKGLDLLLLLPILTFFLPKISHYFFYWHPLFWTYQGIINSNLFHNFIYFSIALLLLLIIITLLQYLFKKKVYHTFD